MRVAVLRHLTPFFAVEDDDGSLLLLSTRDGGYGRKVAVNRITPDLVVLDRAVRFLRARDLAPVGSAFIDVGAHIGTTTLRALTRHRFGSALALEPDPANACLLAASVALNGLSSSASISVAAAGETSGPAWFARGPRNRHGHSSGEGRLRDGGDAGGDFLTVDVTTLDDACAGSDLEPGDVGLVWIDAQGGEPAVLAGGKKLLARQVPVVFAFRTRLVADDTLARLECLRDAGYDAIVDLRHPAIYAPMWEPQIRPIGDLPALLERPRSTDVLVVATHSQRSQPGRRPDEIAAATVTSTSFPAHRESSEASVAPSKALAARQAARVPALAADQARAERDGDRGARIDITRKELDAAGQPADPG